MLIPLLESCPVPGIRVELKVTVEPWETEEEAEQENFPNTQEGKGMEVIDKKKEE